MLREFFQEQSGVNLLKQALGVYQYRYLPVLLRLGVLELLARWHLDRKYLLYIHYAMIKIQFFQLDVLHIRVRTSTNDQLHVHVHELATRSINNYKAELPIFEELFFSSNIHIGQTALLCPPKRFSNGTRTCKVLSNYH